MRETQRNIRTYKKKLIGLKEKLATAGLLFLMSAVMLTTASFAWITLSINPEIKGIETTIAGNGNLEIALASSDANGNVLEPDESQVGDGAIQDLLLRNLTWGNLVNLNDSRYGINNATLKPATLNYADLLASPLEAVEYSRDGRILKKSYNFKYTSYNSLLNNGRGDFEYTDIMKYGVRAISSVHQGSDNTGATNSYDILNYQLKMLNTKYENTIENNKVAISNVMGIYVSDKANSMLSSGSATPLDYRKHIPDMITLMGEFIECMDASFELYYQIAQAQYYGTEELQNNGEFPYANVDDVKTKSESSIAKVLPEMGGLDELIAMYNRTVKNKASLEAKNADTTTYPKIVWANISGEINALVNIATCEIQTSNGTLTVGSISGDDVGTLMGMLSNDYDENKGIVKGGDIRSFEILTGGRMDVNVDITIDKNVSIVSGRTVKANVQTDAKQTDTSKVDTLSKTIDDVIILMNNGAPVVWLADDTYGLVMDFYLRTNAKDSYVILEGKTKYESLAATTIIDNQEYVLFHNMVDDKTYYYSPDEANKYTGNRVFAEGISSTELAILKDYGEFVNYSTGQVVAFEEEKTALPAVKIDYDLTNSKLNFNAVENADSYIYSINDGEYNELLFVEGKASIPIDENINTVTVIAGSSTGNYWPSTTIWTKESNTAELQPIDPNELNKTRSGFVENLEYVEKTVIIGYDGVNRIWQESSEIPENSSTQGHGSCYIFYPNDPIEQQQMLQLLKGMSVAFIDENSQLLSVAVLNTESAYEENGKVTVPLELDPKYSTSVMLDVEEKYVVTALEHGESKLISAIVYIDGEKIGNQDVSSTSNITGYLNIQFGSTEKLNHVEDEKLKNEIYTISASLNDGSNELNLSFDSNESPSATVQVQIEGLEPQNVKASFSRIVNGTQGVKGNEIIFVYNSTSHQWESNAEFDRPGNYVMRSVWVDGVEYELTNNEVLTVNIEGFSVTGITWSESNSTAYHMTSDYTYLLDEVTVSLAGSNTYIPESVQALFRNIDNNTYVTANLVDNGDFSWSGKAAFTNSSTYVLETLVIDGEAHTVDVTDKKTLVLYLGINADVFIDETMHVYEGEDIEVPVTTIIYDSTGIIMSDLNNVYLRYNKSGSISPLFAPMKWNEDEQVYEGTFRLENPGKYEFYSIGINKTIADVEDEDQMESLTSYLYSANAPILTMIPKEPPVYAGYEVKAEQFAPKDDAFMNITINNSSAAIGAVKLYHAETETEHIVEIPSANKSSNADGSVTTWKIDLPKLAAYTQNGTWKLKEVYLSDVYINDAMYQFEGDEEIRWSPENNTDGDKDFIVLDNVPDNIVTYVVNDFRVSISNVYANSETKDPFEKVEFTTTIATPYTRTSKISIVDYCKNDASKYINIVTDTNESSYSKLTYEYTPVTWWTNSSKFATNPITTYDSSLTATTSFSYAGTYTPTFNLNLVDVNGEKYSYSIYNGENAIEVIPQNTASNIIVVDSFIGSEKVEWEQPTAEWNSVSPSENSTIYYGVNSSYISGGKYNPFHTYGLKSSAKANNDISEDKSNIDVYMRIKNGNTEWSENYVKSVTFERITNTFYSYVDISPSEASIKVNNIGNHGGAKTTVKDDNGNSISFEIKSSNTTSSLVAIGTGYTNNNQWVNSGTEPTSLITPVASGSTVSSIDVNYGTDTYTFDFVKAITINNNNSTGW